MADPLSITIAAGSLIESCFKIAKFVYDVYKADEEIDARALSLRRHVNHLREVVEQLQKDFDPLEYTSGSPSSKRSQGTQCTHVAAILKDCNTSLNTMVLEIEKLEGNGRGGLLNKAWKVTRSHFKAEDLALKKKEVKTYTAILQLSLQTVSLSYHKTTTTKLHDMGKQLKKIQSMTNMLYNAMLSGEVEKPRKRVSHLKRWAENEQNILLNASTTAVGSGHKKRKAEMRSHTFPKEKKAVVEWVRWPDSSTPVCSWASTQPNDYSIKSLKRVKDIQSRAAHDSDIVSDTSSITEDGTLGRLIRLAKEKYESKRYKKAEAFLEYALNQAISASHYASSTHPHTESEQDYAHIQEILELLFQCYDKLDHWDRATSFLRERRYSSGMNDARMSEIRNIMAELHSERGQFDKAEAICRMVPDRED